MMNRRGDERSIIYTYYLLLTVILFGMLFNTVKSVESNRYFQQSFESKDLALLIDVLYASPQQASVMYETTQGFAYTIGKSKVTVQEKVPTTFMYAEGASQPAIAFEQKENIMVLSKK